MANSEAHIQSRLDVYGLTCTAEQLGQHAAYLDLLAKWNRTINLTALPVEPPTDAAIDRLIVEPVSAARHIRDDEREIVDLGSGGGSPAIPLQIQRPAARVTLVESRSRKCAFLREVIRALSLPSAVVESRFEDLQGRRRPGQADAVSLRAVRLDAPVVALVAWLLRPRGRVLRFVSANEFSELPGLVTQSRTALLADADLQILIPQ